MLDLNITLLQISIAWEDPKANRENIEDLLKKIESPTNVIILPEMFTSGFTINTEENAESMSGRTLGWMERMASKMNAVITGSIIIKEDGHFYNRLIWMPPSGQPDYYDKVHLFSLSNEDSHFKSGTERKIFIHEQWRFCPQICYDLRFPENSRNNNDYDVLFYSANWPEVRIEAWNSLLKARAIENLCYTAGINRVGTDPNGHNYTGQSAILDFMGNHLFTPDSRPNIFQQQLSKGDLLAFRRKFPALEDQKGDRLA